MVDDYGEIKFPLSFIEAKKLSEVATAASFGWLDKTLIDKNIRDTSEVGNNHVHYLERAKSEQNLALLCPLISIAQHQVLQI